MLAVILSFFHIAVVYIAFTQLSYSALEGIGPTSVCVELVGALALDPVWFNVVTQDESAIGKTLFDILFRNRETRGEGGGYGPTNQIMVSICPPPHPPNQTGVRLPFV